MCRHIDEKQALLDIVTGMHEEIERIETATFKMMHKKAQENDKELEKLKESYKCQKIELLQAIENSTFLSDENMCLKAELNSLKSQPLSKDSKGNCLFAEVDDRDEIKSLKDQLNRKSLTLSLAIIELQEEKEERTKWRLEAMTKQHELELLKLENPSYNKDQKDNSERKEEDNGRRSLKMTENSEVSRKDTTKERSYNPFKPGENEGDIIDDDVTQDVSSVVQSRKVTFAADTVSPEKKL